MKHFLLSAYIVMTVLLLSACGGGGKISSVKGGGDTLHLSYAVNLRMIEYSNYTVAEIRNPWDTLKTLHTYILTDRNRPVPDHLPEGTLLRVPLNKVLIYSAVHSSLLSELNALNSVSGVCSPEYFMDNEVHKRIKQGAITVCGNSMSPDIEKIIELQPEAIMLSPYQNSGSYGLVGKLNIPLIECADYMETSPLGRAEWMRFYGKLVGEEARADSLFAAVEAEYREVSGMAQQVSERPKVISDLKYGSTWYVSGGRSTTGQLYADAGADYVFADLINSGSVSLAFEEVFDKGQYADFWFIKYNQRTDKTYRELELEYAPYAGFKAFRERKIYGCNTNFIPFYEESPFHPEILLKDMVKILHPQLLDSYKPKYFTKLADR